MEFSLHVFMVNPCLGIARPVPEDEVVGKISNLLFLLTNLLLVESQRSAAVSFLPTPDHLCVSILHKYTGNVDASS